MKSGKKLLALVGLCTCATSLFSQNITMLQHNGSATAYYGVASFVNAYNASVTGDTLYLSGGFFTNPNYIDKGINIYGAGHYPDSTTATNKTIITGGPVILTGNADNIRLEGMEMNGLSTNNNESINNITVQRNHIIGDISIPGNFSTPCVNILILQNVVEGSVDGSNAQFLLLSNNIVGGKVFNMNSNLIQNNLFLTNSYMGYPYYNYLSMVNINSCNINNNIFLNTTEPSVLSGTGNFLNNNVFLLNYTQGSNIASGNYINVDGATLFVNQSGNTFNYTHNYHLQSPASFTGTDALQCGIYGGSFPYKEGAVPSNPHIISKNISTATTPSGDLNINISVSAQDE